MSNIYNDDMKGDDAPRPRHDFGVNDYTEPETFKNKFVYHIRENGEALWGFGQVGIKSLKILETPILKKIATDIFDCAKTVTKSKIWAHLGIHGGGCLIAFVISFILEYAVLWVDKNNRALVTEKKNLTETEHKVKNDEMFKDLVKKSLGANFAGFCGALFATIGMTLLIHLVFVTWPCIAGILVAVGTGLAAKYIVKAVLNRERRQYWRAMKKLHVTGIHRTVTLEKLTRKYDSIYQDAVDDFRPGNDPFGWKKLIHQWRLQSIEAAYNKMKYYIEIRHNVLKNKTKLTLADTMDNYLDSSTCIVL